MRSKSHLSPCLLYCVETLGLLQARTHDKSGATLCATRLSGKFNGVMAAIGPIGNRHVMPILPAAVAVMSKGMTSTAMRVQSAQTHTAAIPG